MLPTWKSSGIDNIPGDVIKYGGDKLLYIMTSLRQQIWVIKECPAHLTK